MPVHSNEDGAEYQTVGADATEFERYADVRLEEGEVVVYDRDNEEAWIQSESAIGLDHMR